MMRMMVGVLTALALMATPALAQKGPGAGGGGGGGLEGSAQMLVGTWGDNGDCTQHITLFGDGTFRLFDGGGGRWTLVGDQLTFFGAGGSYQQRVRWIDNNNVALTNPDGSVGRSQRCPSPSY